MQCNYKEGHSTEVLFEGNRCLRFYLVVVRIVKQYIGGILSSNMCKYIILVLNVLAFMLRLLFEISYLDYRPEKYGTD